MFIEYTFLLFILVYIFTIGATIYELKRSRNRINYEPKCSFIVPCYNSEKYIKDTIERIYDSYPNEKIELFVINDCSKDNTLSILNNLKERYRFILVNNEINIGKTRSLNNALPFCKGKIIFIIDSDVLVNKKAINKLLQRYKMSDNVGCVGARIKILEKGLFSSLAAMQYNFQSMAMMPYNLTSAISTWGGCLSIKKEALKDVVSFSENCLAEDMDMVLRLNEAKWRVMMEPTYVETYCPESINKWVKQSIRWGSGMTQCMFNHFRVMIKNPIVIILFISNFLLNIMLLYSLLTTPIKFNINYLDIFLMFGFSLFYLPYILIDNYTLKPFIKRTPNLILFSMIYFPIYSFIVSISILIGIYKQFKLREGERAW